MSDDYQDSLDYLYGRLNYERLGMPRLPTELRLGRMRRLLRGWATRTRRLRIVHVAGTKGKGSTVGDDRRRPLGLGPQGRACSARRTCTGSRSGSASTAAPRPREELVALTDAVRPRSPRLDHDTTRTGTAGRPSSRSPRRWACSTSPGQQVDVVVLEVGMGGRLDSTNVVRPVVSVITTISFDHTRQLGSTLAAIAGEKAGILKRGRPAVSGETGERGPRGDPRVRPARGAAAIREIDVDFPIEYDSARAAR